MIRALDAERVKFFSTHGCVVGLVSFVGLALLLPVVNASTGSLPVTEQSAYAGVLGFSLVAAMVVGATLVTQEYRYRTVLLSHQAAPRRWQPLAAKAVLVAGFGAVLGAVMSVASALVVNLVVPDGRGMEFSVVEQADNVAACAATVAIMAVLAVGVGALVRSTAAAVALVVLWQTPLELILSNLPGVGDAIKPYLLFRNVTVAAIGVDPSGSVAWGRPTALCYLTLVALLALGLGLVRTMRPATD